MSNLKKFIPLLILASSAYAQTPYKVNQTFDGIADQGTYYTPESPCAVRVSKVTASRSLILDFVGNPIYWFAGNDVYPDGGKYNYANLCPIRDQKIQFYCPRNLPFCQEAGYATGATTKRTIQLTDLGDLMEENWGSSFEATIHKQLKLFTNAQVSSVACLGKQHAQAALSVLDNFTQNILNSPTGCSRTILDDDRGLNFRYYSTECVERNMLAIYVNNLEGFFVENDIASLGNIYGSDRGARCLTQMQVGDHLSRVADVKCTQMELDLAKMGLQQILRESTTYCP